MKIGIDARLWSESGVGRYIRNLIFNLSVIDTKNSYIIFLLKKNLGQNLPENFFQIEADFGWYGLQEQIKLPLLLQKHSPDLMHFPHFNVPVFYKGKFVVTVHDLIHQNFAMRRATTLDPVSYKIKQFGYFKIFKNSILKSEKIITPSNYVKNLLVKNWKVEGSKVSVTYEGVEKKIISLSEKTMQIEINAVLKKFEITSPFLFYIGNAHPHKNVEGLIKSYFEVKKNFPDLQLVLSGHDHYFWNRIRQNYDQEGIIYTGFISDKELVCLYKSAQVFVMPSFDEGFGIPILEAMACGCPVLSSEKGSLKEIGGEACEYFNPENSEDLTKKISELLNDDNLKKRLIKKGLVHYSKFSWEQMAKKTLEIYESSD